MADIDAYTGQVTPRPGLVNLTHLIYALHGFSAAMGLFTAAFVVTAFLTGWPSIIAVILNYVKREDVRGTFLDAHFRWQLRTFWFAVLWVAITILVGLTIVGLPVAWIMALVLGIWVLYRIARGWVALAGGRPVGPRP